MLEGKEPLIYHIIRARKRQVARITDTILDCNGAAQTTTTILRTFTDYMRRKQNPIPVDCNRIRRLVGHVNNTLPQEANNALHAPITMDELLHLVKKIKPNKAPGRDGISQDFSKYTWETIQQGMLEIVNQMYVGGMLTDKQTHGLLVSIPKKPKPSRPEDYRPLTLLNADMKLMTRIIANPLSPWLTTLLSPHQYCGIYWENIYQAVTAVRDAIAHAELMRTQLCLLSLDFTEAFDNTSQAYFIHNTANTLFQLTISTTYPRSI